METSSKWPGESDERHPEVFTKPPKPFSGQTKPGQLTKEQFQQFWDEGYVQVNNLISREELDPVKGDISELVDDLANRLHKAGKIKKLYSECGFYERLIHIENQFPGANIILHKLGALTPHIEQLCAQDKILNIVEQLLGTADIMFNPVWNLRTKTPNNEPTTVPWHQDSSYFDDDSYKMIIITAWIPLLDSTEWNGCLQVGKGGHRFGRMALHTCCYGGTWYTSLDEKEMEKSLGVNLQRDLVVCEVPYGGALFFSNFLPHRSLNNLSSDIRWSLDLRWHAKGNPAGMFGMKEALQVRSKDDPNMRIDWDMFNAVNRHEKQKEFIKKPEQQDHDDDEFDTTVPGPWMDRWEIVHMNQHTQVHLKQ